MTDRSDVLEIMVRGYFGDVAWNRAPGKARAAGREDMRSILRALDAAGYAVASREPTEEMVEAATGKLADPVDRDETRQYARDIYAAMITAGNLAGKP